MGKSAGQSAGMTFGDPSHRHQVTPMGYGDRKSPLHDERVIRFAKKVGQKHRAFLGANKANHVPSWNMIKGEAVSLTRPTVREVISSGLVKRCTLLMIAIC